MDSCGGETGGVVRGRNVVVGQQVRWQKAELARGLRKRSTPQELRLWQCLRDGQLDGVRIRRQQVIAGFIADFYCPTAGLVIEIDGSVHADQTDEDRARELIIVEHNLRVLRFTNDQIDHDLLATLARIRAQIQPAVQ